MLVLLLALFGVTHMSACGEKCVHVCQCVGLQLVCYTVGQFAFAFLVPGPELCHHTHDLMQVVCSCSATAKVPSSVPFVCCEG